MPNEADTCRRYVVPKLPAAGWEDEPHRINEQVTFTEIMGEAKAILRKGAGK
jgi:type I restriction enzyme, R subunit